MKKHRRKTWSLIDQWIDYAKETAENLKKAAEEKLDSAKDSLRKGISFLWKTIDSTKDKVSSTAKELRDITVNAGNEIINWANQAINEVSERISSIEKQINEWMANIVKEWEEIFIEVIDQSWKAMRYALEKTENWVNQCLAYVDWTWTYIKNTAEDYSQKAQALAETTKEFVDDSILKTSVALDVAGDVASEVVKPLTDFWNSLIDQYNAKLAKKMQEKSNTNVATI